MTELWRAVVLGLVQGVTEFLPISSSGHLLLIHSGLGWVEFGLEYDVILHFATLLAVIVYFREDLALMTKASITRDPTLAGERRLAWLVMLATAATVVIAVPFAGVIDRAFADPSWIGAFFLVTSATLVVSEVATRKRLHRVTKLSWQRAVVVGLAQAVALFPGVSRAGMTIAAGLGVGLDREQAARFSFLMSIPIILLANVRTGLDLMGDPEPFIGIGPAFAGSLVSFVAAYLSIAGLLAFLRRYPLYVFAAYTALLGTGILIWQLS